MRMSSGPSARKEKPRSAWSICIEETPMSSTTPSTLSTCSSSVENGAWTSRSRPPDCCLQRAPGRDRIRIAVDGDDRGAGRQDGARVAAGAERAVDDDLARLPAQAPPALRRAGPECGGPVRQRRESSSPWPAIIPVAPQASSPAEAATAAPAPARHRPQAVPAPRSGRNCRARQRPLPSRCRYARG